ncbi:DUF456 domain-containing protein [Fictibacillus gelatini]|uniref:DUF456 domain-containing protein n=1 Tax=Fictibacillus gelatini TaxID=225985 RepID=UPI0003FD1B83|nr:DUF456 domain-containing protein [Fictibacillus gelatini]
MDTLYWILIALSFLLAFVALFYPILPGVLFLALGFILYGVFYSFTPFTIPFIIIQAILFISLFVVDYVSNLYGVKRKGGSKAAIWGSTIGLIVGPFVIPIAGLLVGPFLGAVLAEIIVHKKSFPEAFRVGIGSLLGFIGGTIVKIFVQLIMICYFLWVVL